MKKWTIDEALRYRQNSFDDRMGIRIAKCKDYANTEDVLGNFERVSNICKLLDIDIRNPEGYGMLMIILKIDRICNLIKQDRKPENESIRDSFYDLANYVDLTEEILIARGKIDHP